MTSHQIVAVDVPQPASNGRVERTATAGRTLGAGGSAGTHDLLPQLADEHHIPYWRLAHAHATREARMLRKNRRYYLTARQLRAYQHRHGYSWRQFAAAIGVSDTTMLDWYRSGLIDVHTADKIATRLGTHIATIWGTEYHAVAALMDRTAA